jgi:uncharacterized protein YabE (DUF348 family)
LAVESAPARRTTWTLPNWMGGLLALVLLAAGLGLLSFGLLRTSTLLVVDVDGHRYQVRTHATTVGAALRHAGFDIYPEDLVSPGLGASLAPGVVVEVQKAYPVTLSADSQVLQIRTQALTVRELLAEAGVRLAPADEIWFNGQLVQPDMPLVGEATLPRTVSHRGGIRTEPDVTALQPVASTRGESPVIAVRRAASLTLDDDGVTSTLRTTLSTVGQVLQAHGVTLFLGDQVTPAMQEPVKSGMTVAIRRSVPVQIEVDGRTVRTRTKAGNVAGALGQESIALVGKDRVEPTLDAPIQSNMTIRVTRVREEYAVEFDPVPFQTEQVPDPEVEIDSVRVARPGQLGINKRRYRVVHEDDQEVARVLEDAWVAQPPITKTVAYGTKIVVRTLQTSEGPIEYWRKMRVYVTSYKPASCGKPKDHPRYGYTRLGLKLKKGIVAVDPTVIPLNTRMYVPGYGLARAGDTGGAVKGKFVDLGFSDDDYESWHWWMDVYLLTPVPPSSKIRWVLPNWPRYPDRNQR